MPDVQIGIGSGECVVEARAYSAQGGACRRASAALRRAMTFADEVRTRLRPFRRE
jgi:hypothetical protein